MGGTPGALERAHAGNAVCGLEQTPVVGPEELHGPGYDAGRGAHAPVQWCDRLIVPGCAGLQPAGTDEASMLVEDGRPAASLQRAPPGNSYTRSCTVDLACWTSRAAVLIHRSICARHAICSARRGLFVRGGRSRLRRQSRADLSTCAQVRRET